MLGMLLKEKAYLPYSYVPDTSPDYDLLSILSGPSCS